MSVLAGFDRVAEPALDRLPVGINIEAAKTQRCALKLPELTDHLGVPEEACSGGVVGVAGADGLEVAAIGALGQGHQVDIKGLILLPRPGRVPAPEVLRL